jgi:hypothetical protein
MCLPKASWWAWVRPIPIDRGQGSKREIRKPAASIVVESEAVYLMVRNKLG